MGTGVIPAPSIPLVTTANGQKLVIGGTAAPGKVIAGTVDPKSGLWLPVGTGVPLVFPLFATIPDVSAFPYAGAPVALTDGTFHVMTGAAGFNAQDTFTTPNPNGVTGLRNRVFDDATGTVWNIDPNNVGFTDAWAVTVGTGVTPTSAAASAGGVALSAVQAGGGVSYTVTFTHGLLTPGHDIRFRLFYNGFGTRQEVMWRPPPAPTLTITDANFATTSGVVQGSQTAGSDTVTMTYDGTTIKATRSGVNGSETISALETKAGGVSTNQITNVILEDESNGANGGTVYTRVNIVGRGTLAWKP